MATQPHPHSAAKEHEKEDNEKDKKPKAPDKPQGQIDAERAEKGGDVPPEEQGKPNEAREWLAVEQERQAKADKAQFEAERAHAVRAKAQS